MTYCHKHRRHNCQTCIDELVSLGIQEDKERIAELEAKMTWRPIKTAPKDGQFLGWDIDDGPVVWSAVNYHEWMAGRGYARVCIEEASRVSHWMPLPESPK